LQCGAFCGDRSGQNGCGVIVDRNRETPFCLFRGEFLGLQRRLQFDERAAYRLG
jgi:hypothetical protein